MQQLPPSAVQRLVQSSAPERRPVLLDVREPWEFQQAAVRLAGADTLHIPMREIPSRLAEIDPARTIVCVCHHGGRSLQVAHFLVQRGYIDVINLQGGIDAWSREVDPSVPRY